MGESNGWQDREGSLFVELLAKNIIETRSIRNMRVKHLKCRVSQVSKPILNVIVFIPMVDTSTACVRLY